MPESNQTSRRILHLVHLPHATATEQTHDAMLSEHGVGLQDLGFVGHAEVN